MINRIFLKELWDLYQEDISSELSYQRKEKHKLILKKFGKKLKLQGWVYYPYEHGWVSPDRSTIFYDYPYIGQLYPWMDKPTPAYETFVKEMIDSGEFIIA